MMRLPGPRRVTRRTWIPLSLAAVVLVYLAWPAGDESKTDVVEATRSHPESGAAPRTAAAPLGYAKRVVAEILPTDLFESHSWYVAPPPAPLQPATPIVPTAPPLPYTLLGSYARNGEPTVFFLVKNDRIFDARVGDVLEKQYSVDAAENGQLRMTYLPLGIKQSLAVGGVQ
jgi:hypothetical protein